MRLWLAPLLLVACGEWESSGTWEPPRFCSVLPSCDAGLRIAVTRAPLRVSTYAVELVTDVKTHEWSCAADDCSQKIPEDDWTELGTVVPTPAGVDVWMARFSEPHLATGPDAVRLRLSQGEGTLFDVLVEAEYEVVDEDRCHVCERAEVELTLE